MNVLVVGPHPDDQELGMGGTIARLAEQGHDVLLLDMTDGEPTPYGDPETRAKEAAEAARILSPDPSKFPDARPVRRVLLDLPNREVVHTIEARHKVAGVIRAHRTDVMFVPHPEDAHPDHRAVTRIAEDARFDAKLTKVDMPVPEGLTAGEPCYPRWLFHYYCTHLRRVADPTFIFDVSGYVERKAASIRAYHTQFVLPDKNRPVVDWVEASMRYFGSRIGTEAGEPFHAPEPIGLTGLDLLAGLW
jgi:bacillithiol biosynthesis deacetylase BshB1